VGASSAAAVAWTSTLTAAAFAANTDNTSAVEGAGQASGETAAAAAAAAAAAGERCVWTTAEKAWILAAVATELADAKAAATVPKGMPKGLPRDAWWPTCQEACGITGTNLELSKKKRAYFNTQVARARKAATESDAAAGVSSSTTTASSKEPKRPRVGDAGSGAAVHDATEESLARANQKVGELTLQVEALEAAARDATKPKTPGTAEEHNLGEAVKHFGIAAVRKCENGRPIQKGYLTIIPAEFRAQVPKDSLEEIGVSGSVERAWMFVDGAVPGKKGEWSVRCGEVNFEMLIMAPSGVFLEGHPTGYVFYARHGDIVMLDFAKWAQEGMNVVNLALEKAEVQVIIGKRINVTLPTLGPASSPPPPPSRTPRATSSSAPSSASAASGAESRPQQQRGLSNWAKKEDAGRR
jgi:hypothetical protein